MARSLNLDNPAGTSTHSYEIVLSAAVAANQLPVSVYYGDTSATTVTPGVQRSTTNSTTDVDILNVPASGVERIVSEIIVYNLDTAPVTFTIKYDNGSGTEHEHFTVTLPTGRTWSLSSGIEDGGIVPGTASTTITDTANYTTTSTTFVDLDAGGTTGTEAELSITTNGGDVLFQISFFISVVTPNTYTGMIDIYDVTSAARISGDADGLDRTSLVGSLATGYEMITVSFLYQNAPTGTNTYRVQWRASSASTTLTAFITGATVPVAKFSAEEVGI
jgi:hypothetical protein